MISGIALKIMEAGWNPVPAYIAAWTLALAVPTALWLLFSWMFA